MSSRSAPPPEISLERAIDEGCKSDDNQGMATTHPVCVKLGSGAVVGVDLECPRAGCNKRWKASAEVANDYGVRAPLPPRCGCGVLGKVVLIVDVGYRRSWPRRERLDYLLRRARRPLLSLLTAMADALAQPPRRES